MTCRALIVYGPVWYSGCFFFMLHRNGRIFLIFFILSIIFLLIFLFIFWYHLPKSIKHSRRKGNEILSCVTKKMSHPTIKKKFTPFSAATFYYYPNHQIDSHRKRQPCCVTLESNRGVGTKQRVSYPFLSVRGTLFPICCVFPWRIP